MTRQQVANNARLAAETGDEHLAFAVCEAIAAHDYFIGAKNETGTAVVKTVTVTWGNKSCQGHCGRPVLANTQAVWVKGKGVWHPECYKGDR